MLESCLPFCIRLEIVSCNIHSLLVTRVDDILLIDEGSGLFKPMFLMLRLHTVILARECVLLLQNNIVLAIVHATRVVRLLRGEHRIVIARLGVRKVMVGFWLAVE